MVKYIFSGSSPGMTVWFDKKNEKRKKIFTTILYLSSKDFCVLSPFWGFPVYRGIWTVLMLLGVIAVLVASFFIICAAPFASHILYKAGGGIFIAAGGYPVHSVNGSCQHIGAISPTFKYVPD